MSTLTKLVLLVWMASFIAALPLFHRPEVDETQWALKQFAESSQAHLMLDKSPSWSEAMFRLLCVLMVVCMGRDVCQQWRLRVSLRGGPDTQKTWIDE